MSEAGTTRFSTSRLVAGAVTAAVGLGVLLWGVSQQAIWLGIVGFILMAAGVYVGTARTKAGSTRRGAGAATPKKNSAFMDGLEQRWDQRRHQDP